MKLLGFSFAGAPGPVTAGYLSLGELTAVIGPNDAGKTRLVRTFSQAMLPDTALQAERASFFVCLDPREVETLLDAVERWTDGIDLWADRGPEEGGPDDLDLVARTAAAISEVYDERTAPGWREIHEEMCRMGYFSLSADAEQESPAVALSWCTPPPSSLTPRMRDVVAGFLAAAFGDDSDFEGIDVDAVARAVVSGPEPIELVRLGTLPASVLPVPVTLPTSDDAIGQLATDAISELMRHLDWAKRAEDSLRRLGAGGESSLRECVEYDGNFWKELEDTTLTLSPATGWIDRPSEDSVTVREEVLTACAFIAETASGLAPTFIRDRYGFQVVAPVSRILMNKAPIDLRLIPRSGDAGTAVQPFSTESAADGHRIWIQLSVLQAIDVLNHQTNRLISFAQELFDTAVLVEEHPAFPEHGSPAWEDLEFLKTFDPVADGFALDDDEQIAGLVACTERYALALEAVRAGRALPSEIASHELMPTAPVLRTPLFVVDEPERHLHPRAQRQLARWLEDLVRIHNAQALVITHSVAFIHHADGLTYVSRKPPAPATLQNVPDGELTALSEIAADLGLNRGELLAGLSTYLFVEGDSDKFVLEALFPDRLRQIGIGVFPFRGATQLAQIVDAQLLLRYSTAHVAVLLDNLQDDEISRLVDDAGYRARLAGGKTEQRAVAKLLNEIAAQGRTPAVHGIPVEDIFFLLDEGAIRKTFRELRDREPVEGIRQAFEEYPGHAQAREAFSRTHDRWTGSRWKAFMLERYGLPRDDVSWYARVADRMREAGELPEALVDVLDRIEMKALEL